MLHYAHVIPVISLQMISVDVNQQENWADSFHFLPLPERQAGGV